VTHQGCSWLLDDLLYAFFSVEGWVWHGCLYCVFGYGEVRWDTVFSVLFVFVSQGSTGI